MPDETDGVQYYGGALCRSFIDWNRENIYEVLDTQVRHGNEFHLDAMLFQSSTASPEKFAEMRADFAGPPVVTLHDLTVAK